jgi:predicted enzyme related to lactoylglutathione lyase
LDLTVENAGAVRDFYAAVVGWTPSGVPMGDYEDFAMSPPGGGDAAAGICHKRGANAAVPPVWVPYFMVEDLEKSMDACKAGGGELISEPRNYAGYGRWCVIRDPAGAVAALFQQDTPPAG